MDELKNIRDRLSESEERYRTFLETTFDGIAICENGVVLQANPGFELMFGYALSEIIGRPILDFVPAEGRHLFEQTLAAETEQPVEALGLRKDATILHVELVNRVQTYQGHTAQVIAIRDITARVQAQEELQRLNRELTLLNQASQAFNANLDLNQVLSVVLEETRHLLDVTGCSIWLIDLETEELVCQEATGPQRDLVRGWRLAPGQGLAGWVAHNDESLIVSDIRADARHYVDLDQQTGLPLRSILSVPLRTRQKVIGVLQIVDTEADHFGPADLALMEALAATAAIAIDNARMFTQEEQRAVELARTLEQQKELERLRSQFIQNISHELRTPLAIARGYVELLVDGELGKLKPDQHAPISAAAHKLRALTKIVDDLAAILDVETQKFKQEPVDLVGLIQTMETSFQSAAKQAGLTLQIYVPADDTQRRPGQALPPVLGDPFLLQRVVDNLLDNAFKFTPAGGRVTVRLWQEGDNLVLEVADTGIGIPGHQTMRIFERFFQINGSTTRRYGGTGLGLALVKETVEAHGGQVDVESSGTPGQGSTFTVLLPIHNPQPDDS